MKKELKIIRFTLTAIEEMDRHTEPKADHIPIGFPMPPKHEEITYIMKLRGSGDTRKFSSKEIKKIIMDRLENISYNKK